MLTQTLRCLDEVFPISGAPVSEGYWIVHLEQFCEGLSLIADRLFSIVKRSMPNRWVSESKEEFVLCRIPNIVVCKLRLRPRSLYYQQVGKPIPRPENPKGYDAAGIELGLSLCRGYSTRSGICGPSLSIAFEVWGERERQCFHELLIDHRRAVEILLRASRVGIETAGFFENMKGARGRSVLERLLLYYENEDRECSFTLEREFDGSATEADLLQTLLPLAMLYDSAMGYCIPRRSRDRILSYVPLVKSKS